MTQHLSLRRITLCVLFFASLNVSLAQQLVKDINADPGSLIEVENSISQRCFTCGNHVYFLAKDRSGTELWKTDGTEAGTVQVIDLNPGPGDGIFIHEDLNCNNGILYFRGSGLWKSDGTAAGTVKINDQAIQQNSMLIHDNKVLYIANDFELWVSNGTTSSRVRQFEATSEYKPLVRKMISTPFGIMILIDVYKKNTIELLRAELWKSDATEQGTSLVSTFASHSFLYGSMELIGNKIIFPILNNSSNPELWISDGTPGGTTMLPALPTVINNTDISLVGTFNNKLIFSRSNATWVSDGTAAGTEVLIPNASTYRIKDFNSNLYLTTDESSGNGLYKSDGTPVGTQKLDVLGNRFIMVEKLVVAGNKLIVPFQSPATGIEFATSEGNPDDVSLLKDINPGAATSNPRCFANLGTEVIFMANDGVHGHEIWKTDGTQQGTMLVKDVVTTSESANIESIYTLNGKLYFLAGIDQTFRDLWTSDGTEAGTQMALDLEAPAIFGQVKNQLILFAGPGITKTDGTLAGTTVMRAISSGGYRHTQRFAAGDNLFFNFSTSNDDMELWKANIVTNEVALVKDIYPGYPTGLIHYAGAAAGDKFIFPAKGSDASGEEVWVSDGTPDGTFMLKDIHPSSGSEPMHFVSAGERVFFTANSPTTSRELWVTNGSAEGTKMVKEINTTQDGVAYETPARLGNKVVFAGLGASFNQPWISDGTAEGTKIIKILNANGSYPTAFTTANNNKVYFVANDGVHGKELFVTDGTEAGTTLIDVIPGAEGSNPSRITPVKDAVYFYSNNKIYRTLGTQSTTEIVAAIKIESDLYPVGNYLCFLADHPQKGRELYRVDVTKFPQQINFPEITGAVVGNSILLNVTSTSGLPVSLSTTDNNIAINGNTITLLAEGPVTVEATQQGNNDYTAAEKLIITFCVNPQAPVIDVDVSNPEEPILISSAESNNQWFRNDAQLTETGRMLVVKNEGVYKVQVSVEGCHSEFSSPESFVFTAIEESSESSGVYPNPTFATLHAVTSFGNSGIRFQIIDMSGKIISERYGASNETFNVSGLKKGNYIMRISGNGKVMTRVFIKE